MKDMDIHAPHRTRVKFHKSNSDNSSLAYANEILEDGKIYTVDSTVVHGWFTDVYLVEVPGKRFNSVVFEEISEQNTKSAIGLGYQLPSARYEVLRIFLSPRKQ